MPLLPDQLSEPNPPQARQLQIQLFFDIAVQNKPYPKELVEIAIDKDGEDRAGGGAATGLSIWVIIKARTTCKLSTVRGTVTSSTEAEST